MFLDHTSYQLTGTNGKKLERLGLSVLLDKDFWTESKNENEIVIKLFFSDSFASQTRKVINWWWIDQVIYDANNWRNIQEMQN